MISAITSVDFAILYWIQENLRNAFLDTVVPWITSLGNGGFIWILIAVILLCVPKTRTCGICMLVCLAVDALIGEGLLKHIICRVRPCNAAPIADMLVAAPTSYSFPSGHSASSFTAATAVFLCHRRAGIAAYVLAALIAFSRLYCYLHFPTDVLAGILLGICVACILTPRVQQLLAHRQKKA